MRGAPLSSRGVLLMLKHHGVDMANVSVRAHARSGRNRLFLIDGIDRAPWLAKQTTGTGSTEAWLYGHARSALTCSPALVFLNEDLNTVVTEYDSEAETIQSIAVEDPAKAILCLASVATLLATLHSQRVPWAPAAQTEAPTLDPIPVEVWHQSSSAAQELTRIIQASPLLGQTFAHLGEMSTPTGFIHGDLKIDNILVRPDGTILLVDWECGGTGAVSMDVGAVIGSMICIWVDNMDLDDDAELSDWIENGAVSFECLKISASTFLKTYVAAMNNLGISAPTLTEINAHVASWLTARSWADSLQATVLLPQLYLRVAVGLGLLMNPDELWDELW